jgi:hypothetical protein
MPQIDVMDSTWIPARPEVIAPVLADPASWSHWWPGLALTVRERRGVKGVRWTVSGVQAASDAGLAGTAEVWLQPMCDGVVAHFFLRLHPAPERALTARRARRIERDYRRRTKSAFWALADHADPHRAARAVSAAVAPATPAAPGSV